MTDYNDKIRAVVLAALMVFSVFAGTVALSGSATATVDTINGDAATEDVEIGQSQVTQNVVFDVTIDGQSNTETVNINVSEATDAGSSIEDLDAGNVTVGGTDSAEVSLGTINNDLGAGDPNIDIDLQDDTQDGTSHTVTITATLTHDTGSISSESSPNTYNITNTTGTTGTASGTVDFAFQDTTAPTVVINSVSPTSPGQYGTVTVDYNLTDAGTGVDTTGSVTNLTLEDSDGDKIADTSLTTGTNQETTFDLTNLAGGEAAPGTLTLELNGTDSDSVTDPETASPIDTSASVTGVGSDNRALYTNGTGTFDTRDGTGVVFDGADVFQGEEDIEFGGPTSLTGVSGDAEGQTLQLPVSQSQATGQYDEDGPDVFRNGDNVGVTVLEPRVTTFDIENNNGEDISGSSVPQGQTDERGAGDLTVVADYNYNQAEDLELTVENEDGLDVTGDAIDGNANAFENSNGEVTWDLDLSDLNTGTFTIEVAGSDDLDFGSATESTTVTVTGDDDVTLDLASDSVTRGQDVTYTIRGSNAGDTHAIAISGDDFRDNANNRDRIFRDVGDVEYRGYNASSDVAWAVVQIDDDTGVGVGQVDTSQLDTTDVDVDLYASSNIDLATAGTAEFDANNTIANNDPEDDPSLEVEEGEVSVNTPGETYVVGSEVDINGTASEGIEDVAFYVRRQGEYKLLELDSNADPQTTISVDADDTFEKEDVVLSEHGGNGNDLLSQPGTYRFGVIDAADVNGTSGTTPSVNVSAFNTGTSSQKSLRVVDTELEANFQTVGGQVSTDDDVINVTGTSLGSQTVAFLFIDERGNVAYTSVTTDDDNTFEEDELDISGDNNMDLAEGQVSAHALTAGRDGSFGDGELPGSNTGDDTYTNLSNFVDELNDQSLTGDQARARVLDQTTEAVASDDRVVTSTFRLADSQSTIQSVYPEGMEASGVNPVGVDDTMVVEGATNLRPDDNSITVELMTQEGDSVALTTTDEWSYDGQWMVSLELEDVQTGTYDIEADDSYNTDVTEVEIVQNRQTATPEPTDTPEPTATDTPEPTDTARDTPEPDTATDTPEPDTATATPTSEGGPGFGAVIAVIALLAAALLAVRRDN
ncbi:HVO_2072 family ArtA-dependent S-layer glycoprotein [Haloplanus salilacus]|uniref:HVO_2072 family ArtA-dependent S-layer glycoprotein n=1 Tax=Haloplanus salilacus TaxID=2949994 RepID=UPI0030D040D0